MTRGRPPGCPVSRPRTPEPASSIAAQPQEGLTLSCMVSDGAPGLAQVSAEALVAAAELIAEQGSRERHAYERGRIRGFGDGWKCGLAAGRERDAA